MALAIVGSVEGQAQKSAFTGLNKPATISTKTVNPQRALKAPNVTRPLQTPIRPASPSFVNFPKVSLMTWPPRFSTSSFVPRANNPFQPTAPKGKNPFDTAKPIKK